MKGVSSKIILKNNVLKQQVFNTKNPQLTQLNTAQKQLNKSNGTLKFSRQKQTKISKLSSQNPAIFVPQLNLIKVISPLDEDKLNLSKQQKGLARMQTKETKLSQSMRRQASNSFFDNVVKQYQESPSGSKKILKSPKTPLSPFLKSKRSSESSQDYKSQADKEQLLLLEIKQLKRQNTFFKKKIRDLNKQLNGGYLQEQYGKRKSPSHRQGIRKKQKGFPKSNIETMHLSVNLFFQQIKNLLTSVTQLFKIQFTKLQILQFQSMHTKQQMIQQLNQQICPLRKHQILRKFFLKKKLERLSFQEQQKRYEFLLGIFTEYYTYKEQSQRKVVDKIDSMIMYTNDLNKWLIEKAYSKKINSEIQSQKTARQFVQSIEPPKFETLKVPSSIKNHINKVKGQSYSPMPKSRQIN